MWYNTQIIDKFNIVEANTIYGITKADLLYEIILKPLRCSSYGGEMVRILCLMEVYIKC